MPEVAVSGSSDDTNVKRSIQLADDLKQEGNEHFRAKRWDEALAAYRTALGQLPKRAASSSAKGKHPEGPDEPEGEGDGDSVALSETSAKGDISNLSDSEKESAKARSILNANIGACYGDHKEAVASCSEALHDDPSYVKALQRRATSNEHLDTWSSLSSAQEDYNTLLTLLPPSSAQTGDIRRSLLQLKPRIEAAQKKETEEMMGKLKDLGNTVLGKFGLSTDNFKFEPNGQGGYSMNFVQSP
ncbi:hypothetical protein NLI96_g8049 [Meripilus lineatus]|uniref:Tetratricopeptide repeat protein 1 n=1 Tax=Meripilus lineatus TaxID=2056292 RepID=A0AAD5UZN7_9APHY|nr:hypothetical protein NLI96_g8049 [Physisporinus lineatus]